MDLPGYIFIAFSFAPVCLIKTEAYNRGFEGLTEVPDDIPPDAKEVYLLGNNITQLKAGVFSHLSECTYLSLEYNPIKDIESGAFEGLGKVKKLWIFDTKLTKLTKGMFEGLTGLEMLELERTPMVDIEPGSFSGLHNLEYISLDKCPFTKVKNTWWQGLPSTFRSFNLKYNSIFELQSYAFRGLSDVTRFNMEGGKVTAIKSNAFYTMNNLYVLYLGNNNISEIQESAFNGLQNLNTLHLFGNRLTSVNGGMWKGLVTLHYLDVSYNQITSIEPNGFQHLSEITNLDLSSNRLNTLIPSVFYVYDYKTCGHPEKLKLALNNNPLECDKKLCWLKQGEKEQWLKWGSSSLFGNDDKPTCGKYPDHEEWDNVVVECDPIPCNVGGMFSGNLALSLSFLIAAML